MKELIKVGGFTPLTTIDYPDHLSCVIFCQGCAWRCQYCHNPELIPATKASSVAWLDIISFLRRRQGLLDAVVFSGGEATLQPYLAHAMQQVAELGFKVGLHTAGIKPSALASVLPYCDWVGFDVKATKENTLAITAVEASGDANWQSLQWLLESGRPYECRTTVHWDLISPAELEELALRLQQQGVKNYAVQLVRHANTLLYPLPKVPPPADLNPLWQRLEQRFEQFTVR